MNHVKLWLACAVWLLAACAEIPPPPGGVVTIQQDMGGIIDEYRKRYQAYAAYGTDVRVTGACLSACTLVLGYILPEHICITPATIFGFHEARRMRGDTRYTDVYTSLATIADMYGRYPSLIQQWLREQGGLSEKMLYLRYDFLQNLYRVCDA